MEVQQIQNNQILVWQRGYKYFFSYDTLIGVLDDCNNLYLTNSWDYSKTTLKYLRIAFPKLKDYSKKEISKMLQDGEILEYSEFKEEI